MLLLASTEKSKSHFNARFANIRNIKSKDVSWNVGSHLLKKRNLSCWFFKIHRLSKEISMYYSRHNFYQEILIQFQFRWDTILVFVK